jgi:uncharacterized protein involved in outer membrane biogenesis
MSMPRRTKIAIATASVVTAIPVAAIVILLNYDWNRAKPWLNARVSEAIGRPFAINGDLSLHWDRSGEGSHQQQQGWRDWIPWPHLVARDVHLGNPATLEPVQQTAAASGSKGKQDVNSRQNGEKRKAEKQEANTADTAPALAPGDMAHVSDFSFSVNPFALLGKKISIPVLRFDEPTVFLQRNADGSNNWTFKKNEEPSAWKLDLQSIAFSKGSVHLVDAIQKADVTAEVDTIAEGPYGIAWKLSGKYNGDTVGGSGKAGGILSLQENTQPFPIAANVKVGSTSIAVDGTLTNPSALAALDMRLKVAGVSMARLYPLTGLVLPETPPFATEGHLVGELSRQNSHWIYENFTGKVGSSDIGGKLDYRAAAPRGVLTGAITSRQLVFADLAPLIGADSAASKNARGVEPAAPAPGRVLPVETFKTERWTSIDADVSFGATKIIRDKDLPIDSLMTHFILKDGVLSLTPLNFNVAGGKLVSNIRLDGSGRTSKNAIRAELKASARHLQIKQLLPKLQSAQATAGEINADASLSAVGNSVASLLGTSNGEVKALINQGTISKLLLEEMGLNVGNVVLSKLFGDKQVKLNCMASDFAVTSGLMQTRTFIVDTDEAVLNISGTVNLANEKLDLTLKPDTKGFRIFSLRSPLYVHGTFADPDVSVDKGVLALRAGGAVALVAVAPIAALLPLIHTGPGTDSGCGALLANASVKPVAPPPGKTLRARPATAGKSAGK